MMDLDEQIQVVYTCGVCNIIVEIIETHSCIESYGKIYLDDNNYFYPMTDTGAIIRRSLLNDGTEAVVEDVDAENQNPNVSGKKNSLKKAVPSKSPKRPVSTKRSEKLDDIDIELLILEVEKRIPLWNFTIPIEERSRETVSNLWEEVSTALNDVQPNKKPKRRSTKDDDTIIILNRIADAIAKEEPPPVLPQAPQIDDVDGFLIGIGTYLRRLPQQQKMETIIEILNLVHQKCRRFAADN
ncbi:hypothetical protein KQX54_009263 [Cotesia glomerata]|uniref:MADF domain-containing protein n=1 Tax=Cotesia glomerata TaxID=32391 RepID=A0AAV7IAM4_COTGL|nr:hypothetical protein KQX54_009263 [Cotesia glomerata]